MQRILAIIEREMRRYLRSPALIFIALVLPLAARGGAGVAGAVGFYVVVYSLACVLVTLLLYPAVALFGPSGEKEWRPWRVAHRVVSTNHPCRPCGNDGCGGGKISECLTTLPVDDVYAAAQELLSRER